MKYYKKNICFKERINDDIQYFETTPVTLYVDKHFPKAEIDRRIKEAAQILDIEELLKLQNQNQPIQNNEINIEELLKQQNQNQSVQNIQNQNQNVYLQNNQIAQNTQNNQPDIQTTIQNIQKIIMQKNTM